PQSVGNVMAVLAVAAGALLLAQAGLLVWDTFLGQPRDRSIHAHEAPRAMWLAPAIPAALSLLIGLAPEPQFLADFLANAAQAAYGGKVKVSLALWTGLNVPLLLSAIAISIGLLIFVFRQQVRTIMMLTGDRWGFQHIYQDVLKGIDRLGYLATRLQGGKLRTYLSIMLGSMLLLLAAAAVLSPAPLRSAQLLLTAPALDFEGELAILRLLAIFIVVGTAIATIVLQRDFAAIIALSAAGLGMALLMVLEPAPDVALVQVVVDILSTVILVLAITRLPRIQRHRANALTFAQSRGSLARDALIAVGAGVAVAFITLQALVSRPRPSLVTPYYEANAKTLTGAKDIVGAIVVDFRGYDTLIEITVFALAGLGVYTLLRYASKTAGDPVSNPPPARAKILTTRGIGGQPTSAFVHALAYAILPLAMVIAVTHMMYGHNQPGDGFTAGVIISLGIAFWYVVFGYESTKRRLTWLRPRRLIGLGLLLAISQAAVAAWINGAFFSPVDFGALLGLPLPTGFTLSTSFLFEVSICLAVLGSASLMLDTLGHPGDG
ncbi:MAG TPA: hydrogen gas-evolving membrane-bound hydrogenase subunit E, partial [Anaerolineae bacterium]|nr:hydrogen gas-evolving membrane-bound hydrogenase subunit E [Anaerolineae bacterium]